MTPGWKLTWTIWSIIVFGSFLILEFKSLKDKTPGSVTYSQFGWHLMKNDLVHIAVAVFLGWLFIHYVFKGRII